MDKQDTCPRCGKTKMVPGRVYALSGKECTCYTPLKKNYQCG